MLVKAKCIARAWDNNSAREYFPGLEYEIDSDSSLATLTVSPVAYDDNGNSVRYYRDHSGNIKTMRVPKPDYVFEFDRNITRDSDGAVIKKDYTCKRCGEKFNNLASLGMHSNSTHKDDDLMPDDEPAVIVKDGRGRKKNRTYNCKQCGETLPNLYAIRVHNKEKHPIIAETASVPA